MSTPSSTMIVRDIMTENVVTMSFDETVLDAALTMKKMDIGSVIIVDTSRAIGILTESDIVRRVVAERLDPSTTKVGDVMSSPLIHISPETPLTDAMRIMARSGIRRVAVVKKDSLIGIITSRDILQWSPELIDILSESLRVQGLSPVPLERYEEDEFVAYGGYCDSCGEYSSDLVFHDGHYLCEACRS